MFLNQVDENGASVKPPSLTLAVFLTARATCPYRMSEFDIYKKLQTDFNEKGQQLVFITTRLDSAAVADTLANRNVIAPIIAYDADSTEGALSFAQIGIMTHWHMPFKILFDSTYTAIYMRGSDPTPESQKDFEDAILRLSNFVYAGKF